MAFDPVHEAKLLEESRDRIVDFLSTLTPTELVIVKTILLFGSFWLAVEFLKLNDMWVGTYYKSLREKFYDTHK